MWYEGAGLTTKRWLHTDERGSVIALTDAAGISIATNRYDEYGIPQSGNTGRFQYTGQTWVPELGLYYYKARFYSPTIGRFMQTDPIGYKDGVNWYAYVGNDPINRVDPSGLCEAAIGTRICHNNRTTLIKQERVPVKDANGKSNAPALKDKIQSYNNEMKRLTEKAGFDREYGVTAAIDPDADEFVVSLWQGAKRSFGVGGKLDIRPSNRILIYMSHSHTGLGVNYPSPFNLAQTAQYGRWQNKKGPSPDDISAATTWRNHFKNSTDNIVFEVFEQTLEDKKKGNNTWTSERYR